MAVLISTALYAQTSTGADAATASPNTANAATQGGGKKVMRAENRRFSTTVQRAIYKDHAVSDADIVVFGNASTGQVTLAGFISDPDQEQAAVSTAGKVAGVKNVTSKLTLREEGN
ncbi:BON domain-containing protein [Paraburkholderia acidisoli]|nr:BON domain-containing protein [Paraburkholderia acidisoli]